jgi:hypothetical protein
MSEEQGIMRRALHSRIRIVTLLALPMCPCFAADVVTAAHGTVNKNRYRREDDCRKNQGWRGIHPALRGEDDG